MTVLVTGASGLIGSYLCKRLSADGTTVVGLVNKTTNPVLGSIPHSNFKVETCDIRDYSDVRSICKKYHPDTVFHLAAHLPHTISPDFVGVNAVGTTNLITSCCSEAVESFIYASSMSVYSAPPRYLPVGEEHPTQPDTQYGRSKLIGEMLCDYYSEMLRTVVIRYSSVFGMGDTSRVPYYFMQASLKGRAIQVDGDGSQSSDFIYVDDAVDGALLAMKKGEPGQVYNIGSGKEVSVLDLAYLIAGLSEPKAQVALSGRPATRPFRFAVDISKAGIDLGYNSSPLLQGLRKYREEMNGRG